MLNQIAIFLSDRRRRRNVRSMLKLLSLFAIVVATYSVIFHLIMAREGQHHSWFTGIYWTLTVMSTLGFGDITFQSELGRGFSVFVLLSGTMFMLILLPFTFLQFFWTPWMAAQAAARRPRHVDPKMRDHVVLIQHDPLSNALIERLIQFRYSYVLIEPDAEDASRLADEGLSVIVGDLDDPDSYRRARITEAALVVTARSDEVNVQVTSTVRTLCEQTAIIATADAPASVDILQLAGCNHVLQLADMLGESLARRTTGDAMSHVIGEFDELLIAEATVRNTPLPGKTLAEADLRKNVGTTAVGIWERGQFEPARPETRITENTVFVLAADKEQLYRYDSLFAIYNQSADPILIIGSGRVGRAAARALRERNVDYRIIERDSGATETGEENYVIGSAAELEVLKSAGIEKAPAVVLTTRDDDTNVYLAIFCRQLRPDIQIIARANLERNVQTLHRAGTDVVMSYPSMGAREIANLLERSSTVMLAEGLEVVRLPVPPSLEGKGIAESEIRPRTGCSVVATSVNGSMSVNPDPMSSLPAGGEMILIATAEDERKFLEVFGL